MSVIQAPIHATTALAITIATRESRLALWQAEHVKTLLEARGHSVTLLGMTTLGDQILDRSLSKVGGKGLFVKELELALDDGSADIAVHSLKDVPMDLPAGFVLACVMEREDPRDAFVSNHYANLAALPPGATVGTSSLRRMVLLKALRPDLNIAPLRGNLDTRLRKLDEGQFDAIILAAAGLKRLGLAQRIRAVFEPTEMLPAAGQGALGIEIKANRLDLLSALAPLAHQPTWLAVAAERAVSRAMGGSCSMPLAAHAVWQGLQLRLNAAWGEPDDATQPLDASSADSSAVTGLVTARLNHEITDLAGAAAMGEQVAAALRSGGARVYTPTTLG
ncbi:MAG: hydroxymethylbilane synthase [Burkholderiaceae bacterium]|nr:hydroxymethylbilane synthase [Burkholderiaceae bacterium]